MGIIAYLRRFIDNIKFSFIPDKKRVSLGRIYITLVFFIFCYFVISVRLFDLTVLKRGSDDQDGFDIAFTEKSSVSLNRGDILDRNGQLIAVNLVTTSIYGNPKVITNPTEVAKKLSKIFPDIGYKAILAKLQSDKSFIWIKRNISPKEELLVNND